MKILFAQEYPCIRMMKIAYAVKKFHPTWTLELMSAYPISEGLIRDDTPFDRTYKFKDKDSFTNCLDRAYPYDLIHAHNEPDFITAMAIELGDVPVVHDCHDMTTMRMAVTEERDKKLEKFAQEKAELVVYPSEGLMKWANSRYEVKDSIVLFSGVSVEDFIKSDSAEGGVSVIYQGGIGEDGSKAYPYREYYKDFKDLSSQGFDVGIAPKGTQIQQFVDDDDFIVYRTLEYEDLLKLISQHHYAYVGYAFDACDDTTKEYCNAAMPNKVFDALAAGVPMIVRNCAAVEKLVLESDIGLVYHKDVFKEAERRYEELRRNVLEFRKFMMMEQGIGLLIAKYEEIVCQVA